MKIWNNNHALIFILSLISIAGCKNNKHDFDASGTFEADEVIISAEAAGTILQFDVQEGQTLSAGQFVGYIDSLQTYLKKKQLKAQVDAVLSKRPDVSLQIAALEEQLKSSETEQRRLKNLVKADAAPSKQLDDINAQVEILKKQISAQKSSLNITSGGIGKDALPLEIQIEQLNDQLKKCSIVNPLGGTVLTKYCEAFETAMPGKALYKIADLSSITLRAYVTSDQIPLVKLGAKAKVFTDNGKDEYRETEGIVSWVSDKAEFTPKTIQTRDERANLVYAVKIQVKNSGIYKIGMYGEVKF